MYHHQYQSNLITTEVINWKREFHTGDCNFITGEHVSLAVAAIPKRLKLLPSTLSSRERNKIEQHGFAHHTVSVNQIICLGLIRLI